MTTEHLWGPCVPYRAVRPCRTRVNQYVQGLIQEECVWPQWHRVSVSTCRGVTVSPCSGATVSRHSKWEKNVIQSSDNTIRNNFNDSTIVKIYVYLYQNNSRWTTIIFIKPHWVSSESIPRSKLRNLSCAIVSLYKYVWQIFAVNSSRDLIKGFNIKFITIKLNNIFYKNSRSGSCSIFVYLFWSSLIHNIKHNNTITVKCNNDDLFLGEFLLFYIKV